MGSTDLECSVDIASLLSHLDLDSSEVPLPSPTDSVFSSAFTSLSSMTSTMNSGLVAPPAVNSRRRPLLCSAVSLPESFHMPPVMSATAAHQELLSPEPRYNSTPARLEDVYAQFRQQIGTGTLGDVGVSRPVVDASRRAFSIEDAQSFAETLRRKAAAMAFAVPQPGAFSQSAAAAGGGNRKLSLASPSSFDVETGSSVSQQQQQLQSVRYKTELCRPFEEHGTCRYGSKCQFAHGRAELRTVFRHPKYKTEMCRTFHTTGYCPYGTRCHFIHETTVGTDHHHHHRQTAAGSNTAELASAAADGGSSQRFVVHETEQTTQLTAAALHKGIERRRSTIMQMHVQPSFDDANPIVVDPNRRISVGNYNQLPSALPMARSPSFDVAFTDVGCPPSYDRVPPPPGLSLPADIVADVAAATAQRSTGSSPTSEFTSGFSSGGSSGDVNSGPGSPATASAAAGMQFFQHPMASLLPGHRANHAHQTLSACTSLPIALGEPPIATPGHMGNRHLEDPEVNSSLPTVFAELNSVNAATDSVLSQPHCPFTAIDQQAACPALSGMAEPSALPWLPAEPAIVPDIPRDDLDSLQMMASLKPDELAKLIQLVKLCSSPSSGSVDQPVNVTLSRQNSAVLGHQSVQGQVQGHAGSYGAAFGNGTAAAAAAGWNQAPVTTYSSPHHTSTAVCW